MIEQFKNDVDTGLSSAEKSLPSKYFYDEIGDALFVEIMHAPEYYLTRAELEIFQAKTLQLIDLLGLKKDTYFELVELGAGDGLKTKELLRMLERKLFNFDYLPVDISQNALDKLEKTVARELPRVSLKKMQGDYFEVIESLKSSKHPKIVLFLGSNLGNMSDEEATEFIYKLAENLNVGDKLLLGVDLIKDSAIVLPAYDDKDGITAAFNINLLTRINKELGGDFDVNQFKHHPEYTEKEGIAKSFLMSLSTQEVKIEKIGKTFKFEAGEKIATEISRKYNDEIIRQIIGNAAFEMVDKITDSKNYFSNYILKRV